MKELQRFGFCVLVFSGMIANVYAQKNQLIIPGNYPNKAIRIIVGSSPGGGTDISTRLIMNKVMERSGHTFIIDDIPGANGVIATDMVARMAPDGYSLLATSNSSLVSSMLVIHKSYDVRTAFEPIALFTSQPYILAVANSLPVNNVKEFFAYAKTKPGELNYASSGIGSTSHVGMEQMNFLAGIKMQHVPYKGIGPGINDMLADRIQVLFGSVLAVMPYAKSGRVKALAEGGLKRSSLLPDIPSISEEVLPGFEMTGWYGLMAPEGTSPIIINYLNLLIVQAVNSTDIVQKLSSNGAEAPQSNPAQFKGLILRELDKVEKLKESGIKLD